MTKELHVRLDSLCTELKTAKGAVRAEMLDHLRQVLQQLGLQGEHIPAWAREALARAEDDTAEDRFDNMPI